MCFNKLLLETHLSSQIAAKKLCCSALKLNFQFLGDYSLIVVLETWRFVVNVFTLFSTLLMIHKIAFFYLLIFFQELHKVTVKDINKMKTPTKPTRCSQDLVWAIASKSPIKTIPSENVLNDFNGRRFNI